MSTSPSGIFSKLGSVLRTAAPYIEPAAAHLAAAFGNRAPLQDYEQRRQLLAQNDLAQAREQATASTNALHRQVLQNQLDNYETPEQQSERAIRVKRAETPTTYQTDEGQTGIADTDIHGVTTPRMVSVPNPEVGLAQQRTADFNQNFPSGAVSTAPPTLPPIVKRPAIVPNAVGFHVVGYDEKGQPIVSEYSKGGALIGSQPAPNPPAAGVMPGMGKVNPIDAGAAGALPPDPRSYAQGTRDPQYRVDFQKWTVAASGAKQTNAERLANARAAAFGANRPITALDNSGQDVITTLADQRRANPGQPVLAGNQSGAAGLGQKKATFAEVDQNLANVEKYLPTLNKGLGDRAAFAAALTPGTGTLSNIAESVGLQSLSPDQQSLIFAIRNLRQGATSLKNVLSSNGVSDKRVAILESELPNEADLLTGDPSVVQRKLGTFKSVYGELQRAYPSIMSGGAPTSVPTLPKIPPRNADEYLKSLSH